MLNLRDVLELVGDAFNDGAFAQQQLVTQRHQSQEKDAAKGVGLVRLFSVRHEFPTAWAKFQTPISDATPSYTLTLNLLEMHYPFWAQGGRLKTVQRVDVLAESTQPNLK